MASTTVNRLAGKLRRRPGLQGLQLVAAIFSETPSEGKERCMHFQSVGDAGM